MTDEKNQYEKDYSSDGFWSKLKKHALQAGREVVEKALWLYYTAEKPDTPGWAKAAIYSALGYFITPLDAITDVTPLVGYSDDLGVLALAIAAVVTYIDDEVKQQASDKLDQWFTIVDKSEDIDPK